ncbi:MAG: hypothetical protein KKE57_01210 [Proteobacteria bacterium]|nr:hypothetical protein [Pseudomonadota bacterium]
MITVKIKSFFAVSLPDDLRSQFIKDHFLTVEVAPGTTIEGLLKKLPWLGLAESFQSMVIAYINGQRETVNYVLQPGDVVDLHVPTAGG